MPKQVDHAARRQLVLEALWRLTRREGWDAISLRKVAAEAGVSVGLVQHYFASKDEMLRFAVEMVAEDTVRRVRHRIAELPQPPAPRLLVEAALTEMIPRTSRRETEAEAAKVWPPPTSKPASPPSFSSPAPPSRPTPKPTPNATPTPSSPSSTA